MHEFPTTLNHSGVCKSNLSWSLFKRDLDAVSLSMLILSSVRCAAFDGTIIASFDGEFRIFGRFYNILVFS